MYRLQVSCQSFLNSDPPNSTRTVDHRSQLGAGRGIRELIRSRGAAFASDGKVFASVARVLEFDELITAIQHVSMRLSWQVCPCMSRGRSSKPVGEISTRELG